MLGLIFSESEQFNMVDPSLVQFFLFISKLINLRNTLLIMTEEETVPLSFCSGLSFPIICSQYSASGHMLEKFLDQTKDIKYHPIFISEGDHEELITKLGEHPLLFNAAQVWVMPMQYAIKVPLRLDNNIFFYDGNSSSGYSVYESYAIKGKKPETKMLFQWHQEVKDIPLLHSTMDRRSNLNGVVLRDSWVTTSGKPSRLHGDFFLDMSVLQARLNFTSQEERG